jgi:tRNA A-37 threonylcarbamoyl transferase component Bud32
LSEAEITLKYRELPVTITHGVLLVSVPVVTLFTLLCSVQAWTLKNGQVGNISLFVLSLFIFTALVVLALIAAADRTVFLTRDGISLPFFICPRFGLRSQHAWSEVSGIKLLPGGKRGILVIQFDDKSQARLKLDLLPAKQVENLIVSMDVWAGGSEHFPALLEARLQLTDKSDSNALSYTELWEEELTRRFGPTNFIPLEAGHKVREFTVERQLAFGGLSAIYLVTGKNKEKFVLKEAVVPSDADDAIRNAAEAMLNKEAQILASLSHANIARVYDHFLESGRHYILMELIDGEDLRRLVHEHGPQSESDVVTWSLQLVQILQYLHAATPPIIHRDLSPDNLMLTKDGKLVVIDFGAANHFVGTATGTMIGKQAYIAPEQLRGKAEPASDTYAFGCTLFFLLTGEDPEPLSVSHPKELKSYVSREIDELVSQCTQQEAGDRPDLTLGMQPALKSLSL